MKHIGKITTLGAIIVVLAILFSPVLKKYIKGRALLTEASQTRMIQVEQARGELEAAKLRAEAIKIVGKAAQEYPEYRNQEYIGAFAEALKDGKINQIIYVPTEASIPILEAGKR